MTLQTTKVCTLTPQTTKTFEKVHFWRNIPIIPLPHVIFQLKNNIKNSKKKLKTKILFFIFYFKKNIAIYRIHTASFQHRRWARCTPAARQTRPRLSECKHGKFPIIQCL
jgi:hypothetical protein